MTRKRLINFLKWMWVAVVIIGAALYLYNNFSAIASYISSINIERIIGSTFLLFLGKLLLSDITRLSLKKIGYQTSYQDALAITSITQLGKYIPGGIWHFAGKFGVYKARGISTKKATQAMVWENGWLISSAGTIGAAILLLTGKDTICVYLPFICRQNYSTLLTILIPLFWLCLMLIVEKILFKKIQIGEFLYTLVEQIILWILLGISFWMIFPQASAYMLQIIGTFDISWAAGYSAVFAPGGIGVRELLLSTILANLLSSQEVIVYASIHRLVWVIVELLLGACTALIFGIPTLNEEGTE